MRPFLPRILLLVFLTFPAALHAENIQYPANAGVVNVKTAHGAIGDGIADDTAAIQSATNDQSYPITVREIRGGVTRDLPLFHHRGHL